MIQESLAVGIVLERRHSDHPWQDHSWHMVDVIPGAPAVTEPRKLAEGSGWVRYHAATLEVELFDKETEGYCFNLTASVPLVFVVLRPDEDSESDVVPFLATVNPYESQDYVDGDENVDSVPMPEVMIAWVGQFIAEHHVDQPFKKRKQEAYDPEKARPGSRPPGGGKGDGSR